MDIVKRCDISDDLSAYNDKGETQVHAYIADLGCFKWMGGAARDEEGSLERT